MVGICLFGAVKLTTNPDPDKYKLSGHCIEFDARGSFLLSESSGIGENVIILIIFVADMS